jgi:hypothetical protein
LNVIPGRYRIEAHNAKNTASYDEIVEISSDPYKDQIIAITLTGGEPPAPGPDTGNWIDVADVSWYSPYKTEFTIPTVPQRAAEQLAGLAKIVNDRTDSFEGKTIRLAADINLAGRQWTPIGKPNTYGHYSFRGTFNGGGGTIANLTIIDKIDNLNENYSYGLFGANSGNINNIHLTGVSITVSSSYPPLIAGSIVGSNGGTVTDCTASGSIFTTSSYSSSPSYNSSAGGIVGNSSGMVRNCTASVTITFTSTSTYYSSSTTGGIAGQNYSTGTVTYCTASGSVTSSPFPYCSSSTGGIVGYNGGMVTNCTANGNVTTTTTTYSYSSSHTGGVIGENHMTSTTNSIIENNKFSSSTGQMWGIGCDLRKGHDSDGNFPPSNDGCTPY